MEYFERLVTELERLSDRGAAVGIAFVNGIPNKTHFSYPSAFLERYKSEELSLHDNTLTAGFLQDGVVLWSALEQQLGPSKAMAVARTYGMVEGICISVTVNGLKSIASISFSSSENAQNAEIDRCRELMIVTTHSESKKIISRVSQKSLDYAQAAAQGLSEQEIASRLALTIHGARRRRRTLIEECNAKTLAQAMATIRLQKII